MLAFHTTPQIHAYPRGSPHNTSTHYHIVRNRPVTTLLSAADSKLPNLPPSPTRASSPPSLPPSSITLPKAEGERVYLMVLPTVSTMSSAASTLSCSSSTTGPPSIGSSQSSRSRLTQEEDDDEASVHPTAMAPHAKGEGRSLLRKGMGKAGWVRIGGRETESAQVAARK